jgi:hypothetical protein
MNANDAVWPAGGRSLQVGPDDLGGELVGLGVEVQPILEQSRTRFSAQTQRGLGGVDVDHVLSAA